MTHDMPRLTEYEAFSVEDWKDLYYTIEAFKIRVLRRHYGGETDEETLKRARRFQRHRSRPHRGTNVNT